MTYRSSPLLKQLLGALVGVGIALVLYSGVDYFSSSQALLLRPSSPQATPNIDRMRFSDKNVDDATVKQIAYRARTLASALETQTSSASSKGVKESDIVAALVEARRDLRTENKVAKPTPIRDIPVAMESPVTQEKMEQNPNLSQSGLGLWMIVVISGAVAGIRISRKRSTLVH